jgi:hypothetical protein
MCKYNMDYTPGAECIVMCPAMAAPPHGYLEPAEDVEMFQWVTLGCDKGYKPVGNRYVMCKTDSTYLFEHGACVPTCPLYPQVEHGTVSRKCNKAYSGKTGACADTEYLAGDMAVVQCDQSQGFVLSFESFATATCGEGGEFDHDVAVCVAMCPAHPPVQHGKLLVIGPTVKGDEVEGDDVQVICDDGYALEYPEMAAVACTATHEFSQPWLKTEGTHTGAYSRCVAVCPPYPTVEFGTITVCHAEACLENGGKDGDCCGFAHETGCAEGFTKSVATAQVCYEDKNGPRFSTCCMSDADGVGDPVREGSVVQVTCDKGYSDGAYNTTRSLLTLLGLF